MQQFEAIQQLMLTCEKDNIELAINLAKGLRINLKKWLSNEGFGQVQVKSPMDLVTFRDKNSNLQHFESYTRKQIQDVRFFLNFLSFHTLELNFQTIKDLSVFAQMPNLRALYLGDNELKNLDGLEKCTQLEELYLWGNQIQDLSPIEGLTNLKGLTFNNNLITDISPIQALTKLTYLVGSNNLIKDLSPLEKLDELKEVRFESNPVSGEQKDFFREIFKHLKEKALC